MNRKPVPTSYPLKLALRYSTIHHGQGRGRTVNISSHGAWIETKEALHRGSVTLHIEWPVLLNGHIPLQLFAVGRVTRSAENLTEIRFDRAEFKTVATERSPNVRT